MDLHKWPAFRSHKDVFCFSCRQKVKGNQRGHHSGCFKPGQGKYNKRCQCGAVTWYDILGEQVT